MRMVDGEMPVREMVDGQWSMNQERLHRSFTITHLPFTIAP